MAEAFNLLKRVRSLDISPELSGYSGVRIYAGQADDGTSVEYFAGDETGKVLEITNDWGTQAQADAIYRRILGYKYQPYTAIGSQIDPSVELGDAVTVSDVYGGVFLRRSTYGRHITSDVEAPLYGELEHEFQIQSPTNRQYDRFTRQVRASLSITNARILAEVEDRKSAVESLNAILAIQAQQIEARVTKTGGDSSSFGWVLDSTSWTIKANNRDILKATKDGLEVYGKITATSGLIGGFSIEADHLSYNNQTWGGTNSTGVYIGPSGIQLGKNFKVDSAGNLTAASGTFTGSVHAGTIQYGGNAGYFSGGGISGGTISGNKLMNGTITTTYTSSGINAALANGNWAANLFSGVQDYNASIKIGGVSCTSLYLGGYGFSKKSATIKDYNGNNVTIAYWGW